MIALPIPVGRALESAAKGVAKVTDAVIDAGQETRLVNGVALDPRLPEPVAGMDYTPKMIESPNPNIANSHLNGYQAELELANTVAALPDEVVIKYGDKIGRNGADVISVNSKTGEVTLWDSKYRSNPVVIKDSPTFKIGSDPYKYAVEEARNFIQDSNLPPGIINKALENIRGGNFDLNTVGSGNARNSNTIKIRNGNPSGQSP